MFSCEYCEIFKKTHFEEHLRTAPSGMSIQQKITIAWNYFRKKLQYVWQRCKYHQTFKYSRILNIPRIINMSGLVSMQSVFGLVWLISNHMFGSGKFWEKSPLWFLKILKLSEWNKGNIKTLKNHEGDLCHIAIPSIWLLVPMMAGRLH